MIQTHCSAAIQSKGQAMRQTSALNLKHGQIIIHEAQYTQDDK